MTIFVYSVFVSALLTNVQKSLCKVHKELHFFSTLGKVAQKTPVILHMTNNSAFSGCFVDDFFVKSFLKKFSGVLDFYEFLWYNEK